ncbi:c-type heme family protein [Desulfoluna butyratoxydans]|uniref:histidine kinase n=1 Tax=Desulfoluna butyratoxydans TaxID=231438 RepID=A0A4U8YHV8_9BACT|nr:DUF3365 domain-containing protein [Desulfoluna butyratoxydans]VFQ43195.1 protein of unknown function duf3365 [Desulfoluna butyratoxydans]
MKRRASLKNRFFAGASAILLLFCSVVSLVEYAWLSDQVEEQAAHNAARHLATASAIRTYAKDVLRPVMETELAANRFVIESMSTSYISREIMKNLNERFPEFTYKRAAGNPRNPLNRADPFEEERIAWFDTHREEAGWEGMITRSDGTHYVKMEPITVEASCLRCHGVPEDAPKELRERYGDTSSYGYAVGDVVAADTLYIPMTHYRIQIKEKAWGVFIVGFAALFCLMGLFRLLFNRTVHNRLSHLLETFTRLSGTSGDTPSDPIAAGDEVDRLALAFEEAAENLEAAHHDLTRSESKYRRLFEHSPNAILLFGADDRLTDINRAGLSLFKLDSMAEAFLMEAFHTLFWDGRDAATVDAQVKEGLVLYEKELSMVDRFGVRIDALVTATGLFDEASGRYLGMEMVLRDITRQKQINAHLAQTEKLASIGQLAAGFAHEINNPLGVISCYADLIDKQVKGNAQLKEDVGVITKHASLCTHVVESLLNFARVNKPEFLMHDLHGILDDILSILRHRMEKVGVTAQTRYLATGVELPLDPEKIRQLFMNLVINAIQAMDKGGELTVSTRLVDASHLEVTVADTGVGISPSDRTRIFEPFFTTKAKGVGTGLGLSVSYGIVRQHGGTIDVESTPGEGTCFMVTLPLRAKETKNKPPTDRG